MLVVLDACRAGAFALPDGFGQELDRNARIGVVTSASAGSEATETPQGGVFTQALIEALVDPRNVDAERRAVTLGLAFNHAQRRTYAQRPRLFGGLDTLQLAWPALRGAGEAPAVMSAEATAGSALLSQVRGTVLAGRQVAATGQPVSGTLQVDIVFGHDTESVRVGVYSLSETKPYARPEKITPGPWKGGQRQQIKVPLDGLSAGDYRVEVEPCRAEKACGEEPPAKFRITLRR